MPDGITLKVMVSNISAQLPIMEIIQSQLAKVGIKLEMNVVDHPTYHSQIRKDASALVLLRRRALPDRRHLPHRVLPLGGHRSASRPRSPISRIAPSPMPRSRRRAPNDDAEQQQALWKEAQRKIHDDVCAVPLFDLLQVWAHTPRLDFGYELKGALNLGPPITETTTLKPR